MSGFKLKSLHSLVWFIIGCVLWWHTPLIAQDKKKAPKPQSPVAAEKGGKLVYATAPNGDRIPDYSYAGYMASEQPIPTVQVKVVVPVKPGDATLRIQAALDYVAALPANAEGIRGAVLLNKGTYTVNGSLKMNASGVILRGSGMGNDGTILLAAGKDRETFIKVAGKNDRHKENEIKITDAYVPVNAFTFHVASAGNLKAGDKILVHRPSTAAWIAALGVQSFGGGLGTLGWHPGDQDIDWDRKIIDVKGNAITVDAPLTTALDTTYGGGTIAKYDWQGRIAQVGIENILLRSAYDTTNPKDEAHRWMAITMENVSDAWVRQVTFQHFAGSAVFVLETANRVTVEDCRSLAPVSEIGGYRRNTFWTMGGQTLFQRLYSEQGYHDFGTGFCTPGPTAFVQCMGSQSLSFSGGLDSWASGVLFDVTSIDGQAISYKNREQDGQGAGWNAANSMLWNCTAAHIDCYAPPTAQNWAYGAWAQFGGNGYWESANSTIAPRSFFYAQLTDRLGKDVSKQADILQIMTEPSSSPTPEQAAALMAEARKPQTTMGDWVNSASKRKPISIASAGAKSIDDIGYKTPATPALAPAMAIKNGWLVRGNSILQGMHYESPWWNGNVKPNYLEKTAKPDITRWVPGRTGTGLTDDLNEVSDWLLNSHTVVLEHNYGLWYERRRDDHERIRRADGDVWAPFYELPFGRSGSEKDLAYDGLSKYDLTKYNIWYWSRLKQFADLADQKGLVLFHNNFFQHNIIEAGAHYTDFPWRTANNINSTGFPEPVNYAGDKRQFMAEQFYDETDPARRKLLVAYINKCMDNFAGNNGVLQATSAEFTGPLHFMQFWVETVKQWEIAHKQKQIITLSATKDVQDGILNDPSKASVINAIDIRYWYYEGSGKLYAPLGGQSLAPRQQERVFKPKAVSFESVYNAVHEYRVKYPEKAVLFSADGFDHFGWAVFIAGGSLPVLPAHTDKQLLTDAATMLPVELSGAPKGQWALGGAKGCIVYSESDSAIKPKLTANINYKVQWIDPKTGEVMPGSQQIKGGEGIELKAPKTGPAILWLSRI
ncbi:pectate lyase [Mucilaginibacter mali]|uniref:Pectate lyase n=1 Tax=Mucilaginibacter mali TaxID=2740462 RepID=A0A7D4U8W1_9SPHI|nr:pectate lyase [Mucilaginibacter mali]